MFTQFQSVELIHDMLSDETIGEPTPLKEGQPGVVLEIYSRPDLGTAFDCEFFDDDGNTVAVMIVQEEDIRPRGRELQVRE
jgi:hypothetical protein